jgi:hypothetical protein
LQECLGLDVVEELEAEVLGLEQADAHDGGWVSVGIVQGGDRR